MTQEALAGIFLGEITQWNDPKITSSNPGVSLPEMAIIVAHRSDGSGTTNIFTDYLTKVSKTWEQKVGRGPSVKWPVGLGGKGNEGVSGLVKQSEGAVGYVELAYAVKNNLPYASLRNKAGKFAEPTFESVSAAAAGSIKTMPADLRVSITDADGADSYPISGFTWLLDLSEWEGQGEICSSREVPQMGNARWAVIRERPLLCPLAQAGSDDV